MTKKKFFPRLVLAFKKFKSYLSGKNDFVIEHADKIVNGLEHVKRVIESPVAFYLVKLTRTPLDDKFLELVKRFIPVAIARINFTKAMSSCMVLPSREAQIECILKTITEHGSKKDKGRFLNALGASILSSEVKKTYGLEIPESETSAMITTVYENNKINKMLV